MTLTPLQILQQKSGVEPDGSFGPNTFKAAMKFLKLTPVRAVHFFAQTAHETGEFKLFVENLNYSATGLKAVFPKYFPTDALANKYARNPQAIANRVYASRMGNGNEGSGDGWKYRGRGALQLTGRANYQLFADFVDDNKVVSHPEVVSTEYAFQSAMFFFERNKLWSICDRGFSSDTIEALTKRINGGTNGLKHRAFLTAQYAKWV